MFAAKKIMGWVNYHSHSTFSDGKEAPEAYVQQAIALGMPAYGFSDHAPLPFDTVWAMPGDKAGAYVKTIQALKEKYSKEIELYTGLEIDYIPGKTSPANKLFANMGLDYKIGSVHYAGTDLNGRDWSIDGTAAHFDEGVSKIYHGDIKPLVRLYYQLVQEMVTNFPPDFVGHIDKIKMHNLHNRYFNESDDWYKELLLQTIDVVAARGIAVEVSTRGMCKGIIDDLYPSSWVLGEMCQRNIPVVINADNHHSKDMQYGFGLAADKLLKAGYRHVRVLYNGKWQDAGFDSDGIYL
ncbi:MAG: histidinol-phosphatase [Bacteroidales bacterium]|nr:histidinol-phosphatase [Bacteroidales bacterium]